MIGNTIRTALRRLGQRSAAALSGLKSRPSRVDTKSQIKSINRPQVEQLARGLSPLPASARSRSPRLIVSLTSYPARIDDAFYTIVSLLDQSMAPDAIVLWLNTQEFPRRETDVPERVLELRRMGLHIAWCSGNVRSYGKLVHALSEFPDDLIVTADDDIYYETRWLELLFKSYLDDPHSIHAHRAHRCRLGASSEPLPYETWEKSIATADASLLNFPTGCGGVLYPPHLLHEDVTRADLFTSLCPTADDVWFWCMAVRRNTKIRVIKGGFSSLVYVDADRELGLKPGTTLYQLNRTANDRQISAAFALMEESIKVSLASST